MSEQIGLSHLARSLRVRNVKPLPIFQQFTEIIRLFVMMYVRFPLSLRQVEELLSGRSIETCHETDVDAPCMALSSMDGPLIASGFGD